MRCATVTLGSILLLAVGLAMDATAVAAARGMAATRIRVRDALLVAGLFGGFQALMPALGFFVGARLDAWLGRWDYWLAFALLAGVGLKMLWEARKGQSEASPNGRDPFGFKVMLVLAVATSIDAWAVGITLPILGAQLLLSLVVIGVTTAVLSVLGLSVGRRFGSVLGRRLDAFGGILLLAMGLKLLLEHRR
jgi:putative Mn2+ efflux pump MntP